MAKTSTFFYTEEQNKELKRLAITDEKGTTIAKRLSKQWKRHEAGIYCKLTTLHYAKQVANQRKRIKWHYKLVSHLILNL